MWSLKKQLIVTFVMFALREPKLNCWDILLTVHNSVHCVHVIVLCTLPLYRMPWVYRCTVRQSSGVSFNHFISSLLLDTKCQTEESQARADNGLPLSAGHHSIHNTIQSSRFIFLLSNINYIFTGLLWPILGLQLSIMFYWQQQRSLIFTSSCFYLLNLCRVGQIHILHST